MTEQRARELLGLAAGRDGMLTDFAGRWLTWHPGEREVHLKGAFTADELEAIAWWMRNRGG